MPTGRISGWPNHRRLGIPIVVFLLSVVALLAACGDGGGRPAGTPVPLGTPDDGVLRMEMFEWGFSPESVVLTQDEEVRILLENVGEVVHNIRIDDLGADGVESQGTGSQSAREDELFVGANSGDTGTLVFTPRESGTFDYYCTIRGHRSLGMEGTLTVR